MSVGTACGLGDAIVTGDQYIEGKAKLAVANMQLSNVDIINLMYFSLPNVRVLAEARFGADSLQRLVRLIEYS